MREIKFRGYCAEYNQWFYGVGIWHKYGGTRIVYDVTDDPNCEYKFMLDSYEVEKDSVGQYTGLKDCDAKEIYEGDILKDNGGYIGKVRYNSLYARFEIKVIKAPAGAEWQIGDDFDLSEININENEYKVIGNIYENTELIGGKNE